MKKVVLGIITIMVFFSTYSFAEENQLENQYLKQGFLKRQGIESKEKRSSGSGRITTDIEMNEVAGVGRFRSQCFWSSDINQNIDTYGVLFTEATPLNPYVKHDVEFYASYLSLPNNARVQVNGTFFDYGKYGYVLVHQYNLMGNGTYYFKPDEILH